jgi:hypothetical protein
MLWKVLQRKTQKCLTQRTLNSNSKSLSGWRSWFRYCITSRKVAGSIPNSVTWIFNRENSSGHTMILVSTRPLTEMSTGNNSWRVKRPVYRADNLTTFMCRLSANLGPSTSWSLKSLSRDYYVSIWIIICGTRTLSGQLPFANIYFPLFP